MTSSPSADTCAPGARNPWLAVAGILGALAVGLGAFGAHALRDKVPPRDLEIWETAVHYHLAHAIVLLAISLPCAQSFCRINRWTFLIGILIFSGTLYTLVLTNQRWLGAITPIGGVLLITGWLQLSIRALWSGKGSSN